MQIKSFLKGKLFLASITVAIFLILTATTGNAATFYKYLSPAPTLDSSAYTYPPQITRLVPTEATDCRDAQGTSYCGPRIIIYGYGFNPDASQNIAMFISQGNWSTQMPTAESSATGGMYLTPPDVDMSQYCTPTTLPSAYGPGVPGFTACQAQPGTPLYSYLTDYTQKVNATLQQARDLNTRINNGDHTQAIANEMINVVSQLDTLNSEPANLYRIPGGTCDLSISTVQKVNGCFITGTSVGVESSIYVPIPPSLPVGDYMIRVRNGNFVSPNALPFKLNAKPPLPSQSITNPVKLNVKPPLPSQSITNPGTGQQANSNNTQLTITSIFPNSLTINSSGAILIQGNGFNNPRLTSNNPGVSFSNVEVSQNKSAIRAVINMSASVKPGTLTITVNDGQASAAVNINLIAKGPNSPEIISVTATEINPFNHQIIIQGTHLAGASLKFGGLNVIVLDLRTANNQITAQVVTSAFFSAYTGSENLANIALAAQADDTVTEKGVVDVKTSQGDVSAPYNLSAGKADIAQFSLKLENPLKGTPKSIPGLIGIIANFLVSLAIPVAVLIIIYSGFMMLTSGGEPGRYQKGLDALRLTLLGLAVIFIAKGFVTLIQSILNVKK